MAESFLQTDNMLRLARGCHFDQRPGPLLRYFQIHQGRAGLAPLPTCNPVLAISRASLRKVSQR